MATYSPTALGVKPPSGGFQQGGWYEGRQYWGGTLSDPGVIHPMSNQVGAGQAVSAEVNLQSDAAQGNQPGDIERYLAEQRQKQSQMTNIQSAVQGQFAQPTATAGAGASFSGADMAGFAGAQETINLPEIYNELYSTSGISEKEQELVDLEGKFLESKAAISDNPFAEASMVDKRLQRLSDKYEAETKPLRDEIAMKKADIETQLNLQTQQFDINSQAAQNALNYFNTLLESGALSNVGGEAIAELTRATGIPSAFIQSAIASSKAKDVSSQMITSTADDGTVTATLINTQTGQIISQQNLGRIGNAQTGGSPSQYDQQTALKSEMVSAIESVKNDYGHISPQDWQGAMASWIARGGDRESFIANFQQYADPNRGDFDQVYYQREY